MNYLDFQGIFLINKKAIFKYQEKEAASRGIMWEFPKLFVGSARVGHLLQFFYVQNRGSLLGGWGGESPILFLEKVTPRQPCKSRASWRHCQGKTTVPEGNRFWLSTPGQLPP